jgi:uracil-DNA glycosylase family 4
VSAVPTDEIYQRYLDKAINEINRLHREITEAAGGGFAAQPTGHPLANIFLVKYGAQASELQEGIAFRGRSGEAIKKSLQRLRVDAIDVYGTNCLKFAGADDELSRDWLRRELRIVQPKLVVVMGDDTLRFVNELTFPLSRPLAATLGELQRFTPTIEALVVPDIDASLDEQSAKTTFWNAFKTVGPWWAELPPY